jgi:hypothetical protein
VAWAITKMSSDRMPAIAALIARQLVLSDVEPATLDQQLAALWTIRTLALWIENISHVNVIQSYIIGDITRPN